MQKKKYINKNINIDYSVAENIYLFHNVFDKDFCQELIDIYKIKNDANLTNTDASNKMLNCDYFCITRHKEKYIDSKIFSHLLPYYSILNSTRQTHIKSDEGYAIRRIHGPTTIHCDASCLWNPFNTVRSIALVIALNSDYDGGIFEFPHHNISIKLNQGDMICFPPFWTHPHKVSSPLNNTYRYTIHTWGIENTTISWDDEPNNSRRRNILRHRQLKNTKLDN